MSPLKYTVESMRGEKRRREGRREEKGKETE